MGFKRWLFLGVLAAAGLSLGLAGMVYSQKQEAPTFEQRLAKAAGVNEETAAKLLKALGPGIMAEVKRGGEVVLDGLGTFKVVRIPEHKDLQGGRPVTIAATNYVVFLPANALVNEANEEGVKPATTVPPFEYIPLPNQTPSQKTGRTRVPPVRTR